MLKKLNKKEYIICFGNGPNQKKIIRSLEKYCPNSIILDRKKKIKFKKKFIFLKTSIYDYNFAKLKKSLKKYKVFDIAYRSSGPSVLLYHKISKFYKLNKISYDLAKCVYSKTFLSNYLDRKKIKNVKSNSINFFYQLKKFKGLKVFKPDAPLIGKKNIFFAKPSDIDNSIFEKIKKSSHNKKVSLSSFRDGKDVTAIYFKNKRNHKIKLLSIVQEFNYFKNNTLYHFGVCSPQLFKFTNSQQNYINNLPLKLNPLFKEYNGFFSISLKFDKNFFFIYEINVGLSGDKYAEIIFPKTYLIKNIFEIDVRNLINNIKNTDLKSSQKFIGILNKKIIFNKKNIISSISKTFNGI